MIKEIIIIVLIAGGIFFGYTLSQNNWDIAATFGGITGAVSGIATEQPLLTSALALGGPTIVGAVSKLAYNGLKKDATKQINGLQNDVVDITKEVDVVTAVKETEINALKNQIDELKLENPDLEALKTTIQDKENLITEKENKLEDAITQREGIEKMHTKFVEDLTSGVDTVIDPLTNQIYKVIKLPAQTIVV